MPDNTIQIEVKGLDKLMAKFDKFPKEIARNFSQAGHEAANRVVLPTEGLQKYIKATNANRPPAPYYIRGKGTQYASGKNSLTSERLGTQWYVKITGASTAIGNRASYAKWVHGDQDQAGAMGSKGWRKLFATAMEKVSDITKVYQSWINKTIKDLGL